jgi:mono/diheme cytochrome c family protein
MRGRARLAIAAALAVVVIAVLLVVAFRGPGPRPAASETEQLWMDACEPCHGVDGRGSWRATAFLIRPGDLTDPAATGRQSDRYLFDIIKHGGSPIGRPGMPGFPHLSDAQIEALVRHIRSLQR